MLGASARDDFGSVCWVAVTPTNRSAPASCCAFCTNWPLLAGRHCARPPPGPCSRTSTRWQSSGAEVYDFVDWLRNRRRELPGDDIEFGFPHGATDASRARDDAGAEAADRQTPGAHGSDSSPGPPPRPENVAAWRFWQRGAPYDLHLSMHGMGVAAGPYFLIERSWWPRFAGAAAALSREVAEAGYTLHDAERQGEKGFHRLAPGFCSRPDSRAMRRHFLKLGDPATAARFRPSSMEAVRVLSGRDTLTLVTEMPLFILPGVGREPGPPDPVFVRWRERIAAWEARLVAAEDRAEGAERVQAEVRAEAAAAGVRPMPVRDQMRFQRALLGAGLGAMGGDRRLL